MSVRNHYKLVGAAGAAALTLGALAGPALAAGAVDRCGHLHLLDHELRRPSPVGHLQRRRSRPPRWSPASGSGDDVDRHPRRWRPRGLASRGLGLGHVQRHDHLEGHRHERRSGPEDPPRPRWATARAARPTRRRPARSPRRTKAGTFTFKPGRAATCVTLTGFDASGKKINSISFPTTGTSASARTTAGTTTLMDAAPTAVTITVIKDSTTTKDKASTTPRRTSATGTATVKSKFGIAGTGKVTFTLKKGSKTVKTVKGTLKKGVAKATFKKRVSQGQVLHHQQVRRRLRTSRARRARRPSRSSDSLLTATSAAPVTGSPGPQACPGVSAGRTTRP